MKNTTIKKISISLILFICLGTAKAQFLYNSYPAFVQPQASALDSNINDISFAFSMRKLRTEYLGYIIELRRSTDNAVKKFTNQTNQLMVDTAAIRKWLNGGTGYVVTWYDQSGLNRNADQPINDKQPEFKIDTTTKDPYFQGDGHNDELVVATSIQDLTNAGKEGSVLGVFGATSRGQFTFGTVLTSDDSDRWTGHVNYSDGNLYFDPGLCCAANRSFSNGLGWQQLSFIKLTSEILIRKNGVDELSGTHTSAACNSTLDFGICHAVGYSFGYATTKFQEMIMYKTDIDANRYKKLEKNQKDYWGL